MDHLPLYISLIFIASTLICLVLFFYASQKNFGLLALVLVLAIIQAWLALSGFFMDTQTTPPRLIFMLAPSVLLIILAFTTTMGKRITDSFDIKIYTWLQSIRIVVEIVILWLFIHHLMPQSMTFEGRNFDIISGLSAPIVAWLGFRKLKKNRPILLVWNIICLILVLQVVITGIFSAPSVFQRLSFDQPNTAILYFPFVWLPGIIVPIVIYGHLLSIRQLLWHKNPVTTG